MNSAKDLKKLQNGSDIRGIALEGVEGETPNLGTDEAKLLSLGFLLWLSQKTGKKPEDLTISIGRDPRVSGANLLSAAACTLMSYGVRVIDSGLASTPAMFMSTVFPEFKCDGAFMITASHLPFNRNGFKYFDKNGGLNKGDIKQIIEFAESPLKTESLLGPHITCDCCGSAAATKEGLSPLMERYCAHLREMIKKEICEGLKADPNTAAMAGDVAFCEKPLSGLHIVVDAGNGSGGFYAANVLEPLGANTSGSLYLDPDGLFPNHAPNPENKAAMRAISTAVVDAGADLGIIFDTDVDRSAAVDEQGREIARNGIVAMAAALISDEHCGSTVVTDSITSNQLTAFLEDTLKLKHLRFKRGYKNVINKAIELNEAGTNCQLAIETSGHAAYKENYFLDDGTYLASKIVIKTALLNAQGKKISSIIESLAEPLEAREVRFPITAEDFGSYGDKVIADLEAFASEGILDISLVQPNYEGVRINFGKDCGNGWCLLRKSLHDPIMPLNIESDSEGGSEIIANIMRDFLAPYDQLDISKL